MQIIEYTSNKNFFELKMRNIGMMYKVGLGLQKTRRGFVDVMLLVMAMST